MGTRGSSEEACSQAVRTPGDPAHVSFAPSLMHCLSLGGNVANPQVMLSSTGVQSNAEEAGPVLLDNIPGGQWESHCT